MGKLAKKIVTLKLQSRGGALYPLHKKKLTDPKIRNYHSIHD